MLSKCAKVVLRDGHLSQVEDDHASASQCSPSELLQLEHHHVAPFRSLRGEIQYATTQSRPPLACTTHGNSVFQRFCVL